MWWYVVDVAQVELVVVGHGVEKPELHASSSTAAGFLDGALGDVDTEDPHRRTQLPAVDAPPTPHAKLTPM
jgi:hypothetical protein